MFGEIKKGMDRRSFFKWSGLSVLGLMIMDKIRPAIAGDAEDKKYWNDEGYFHQDNINVSEIDQGILKLKGLNLDGWKEYNVVYTDEWFPEWNFSERLERIQGMIDDPTKQPQWGGAHNPSVSSFGGVIPAPDAFNRSQFRLNNAIKGMGLAPKETEIDRMIQEMYAIWDEDDTTRVLHLKGMYTNRDQWDMNKQISLELYATPERLTHSFINWMENPLSTISFMGLRMRFAFPPPGDPVPGPAPVWMPTYELRCAAHMIHPMDPAFDDDDYEFKLIKFSNTVHDFYHHSPGEPPPVRETMSIGVIHYILEEFDNDFVGGKSKRVAFLRILDWPRSLYAKVFGKTKQLFARASRKSRVA